MFKIAKNVCRLFADNRFSYSKYEHVKRNILVLKNLQKQKTSSLYTCSVLQKRRKTAEEKKSDRIIEYSPKSKAPVLKIWRLITPRELSEILNRDLDYVSQLFLNKIRHPDVPIEDLQLLKQAIGRSGYKMEIIAKPTDELAQLEDKDIYPRPPPDKSLLKPRPPVVTIMGHVDHGKTTLLDALRHSSVVEKEFGGITQHIGAFSVLLDTGERVTFLDTPGHAAFSAMRARGANITDIVVLVVAADDGVMEQTVESIRMARNAKVPILIAINKIDSHKADIDRTKKMLLQAGLQVEDLGGDIQTVPISALKKQNLNLLIESLVLQAELLEIKADYTGFVEAVVVESKIDRNRGKLCTVVVKRGTLKKGATLVAGTTFAKVRVMRDADGQILKEVTPGYPAEIEGWKELPSAGELVLEVETERKAREVVRVREEKNRIEKSVEEKGIIMQRMQEERKEYQDKLMKKRRMGRFRVKPEGPRKPEIQEDDHIRLSLVVKADVDGSVEAILDTLDTYDSELCEMDLVHYGVGGVTEGDVDLAHPFKAVVYAFNVECPENVRRKAESLNVPIKSFNVIYKLVEDVKEELNIRLPQIDVEDIRGEATVLQQFDINQGRKKVPVAGCRCTKGVLKKSGMYKLIRNGEVIHTGRVNSLRHLKDEVESIKVNTECGLQLDDKTVTFEQGDTLQYVEIVSKPQFIKWDPGF